MFRKNLTLIDCIFINRKWLITSRSFEICRKKSSRKIDMYGNYIPVYRNKTSETSGISMTSLSIMNIIDNIFFSFSWLQNITTGTDIMDTTKNTDMDITDIQFTQDIRHHGYHRYQRHLGLRRLPRTLQKTQISRILWPWTSHLFSTSQSFSTSGHSHLRH